MVEYPAVVAAVAAMGVSADAIAAAAVLRGAVSCPFPPGCAPAQTIPAILCERATAAKPERCFNCRGVS